MPDTWDSTDPWDSADPWDGGGMPVTPFRGGAGWTEGVTRRRTVIRLPTRRQRRQAEEDLIVKGALALFWA